MAQCQELFDCSTGAHRELLHPPPPCGDPICPTTRHGRRLDDKLKFLADIDAQPLARQFRLFRVIVWAIPIMGFLGTVIGITIALNGIDKNALELRCSTS